MAAEAVRRGIGLGEAAGRLLSSGRVRVRHAADSLLIAAYQERVPVTVHLAIGVDTPDTHRAADGASLGAASHHDFRLALRAGEADAHRRRLSELELHRAGPGNLLESGFLGARPRRSSAADHHSEFRPPAPGPAERRREAGRQALRVPQGEPSRNYAIAGHHEIMLPLVAAALVEGASGVTLGWRRTSKS